MTIAENLFFQNMPPERQEETKTLAQPSNSRSGTYIVQATPTSTTASLFDWVSPLSVSNPNGAQGQPQGKVWLSLEALSADCYVRFGYTNSQAATTPYNGRLISAGLPAVGFYVDPRAHRYIDVVSVGGAGTLKVQVSSPIGERSDF